MVGRYFECAVQTADDGLTLGPGFPEIQDLESKEVNKINKCIMQVDTLASEILARVLPEGIKV